MNIKNLKDIINSDTPDDVKRHLVIQVLALDEQIIPDIMKILEYERKVKKELITDLNLELSRAHCYIELTPEGTKTKSEFTKNFVLDCIAEFYIKNKARVTHCFNRFK